VVRAQPGNVMFSILQATEQVWQPVQRFVLITIAYLGMTLPPFRDMVTQ
jgi:hypothetical protein